MWDTPVLCVAVILSVLFGQELYPWPAQCSRPTHLLNAKRRRAVGVGSTGPDSEDGASPHDDVRLLGNKTDLSSSASEISKLSSSWIVLLPSGAASGIGASSDSAAEDNASPLGNPSPCKEMDSSTFSSNSFLSASPRIGLCSLVSETRTNSPSRILPPPFVYCVSCPTYFFSLNFFELSQIVKLFTYCKFRFFFYFSPFYYYEYNIIDSQCAIIFKQNTVYFLKIIVYTFLYYFCFCN